MASARIFLSAILGSVLLAACGAPETAPTETAATETAEASCRADIPAEAVELQNGDSGAVWVEKRDDGRFTLYECYDDSDAMSATSGTLEGLEAGYPDVDFTPVM